jgi:hypothetical protein
MGLKKKEHYFLIRATLSNWSLGPLFSTRNQDHFFLTRTIFFLLNNRPLFSNHDIPFLTVSP